VSPGRADDVPVEDSAEAPPCVAPVPTGPWSSRRPRATKTPSTTSTSRTTARIARTAGTGRSDMTAPRGFGGPQAVRPARAYPDSTRSMSGLGGFLASRSKRPALSGRPLVALRAGRLSRRDQSCAPHRPRRLRADRGGESLRARRRTRGRVPPRARAPAAGPLPRRAPRRRPLRAAAARPGRDRGAARRPLPRADRRRRRPGRLRAPERGRPRRSEAPAPTDRPEPARLRPAARAAPDAAHPVLPRPAHRRLRGGDPAGAGRLPPHHLDRRGRLRQGGPRLHREGPARGTARRAGRRLRGLPGAAPDDRPR